MNIYIIICIILGSWLLALLGVVFALRNKNKWDEELIKDLQDQLVRNQVQIDELMKKQEDNE